MPPTVVATAPAIQTAPAPWSPDLGNGSFANPVLFADYSDPDAIRVGDDFYLIASSFNCTPGLPILHSKDLVNWQIINHAVKQLPGERFRQVQPGCGVWAAAIRFHAGKYWIFFPMPDEGIYVTTATDPAGQWSTPHLLLAGKGLIDPCPLWDDDGQAYLVHAWAASRSGIKSILTLHRMSANADKLLGEGKMIFDGRAHHPTIEGPKIYKRNGYYYIFAPAGGVKEGWQTILRSKNINGPYEDKIVLEQGDTDINGPHQGAWLDTQTGEDWFMHFQDRGAFGRVVHLQPMRWQNDWPVMGQDRDGDGKGEPVLSAKKPNVGKNFLPAAPQTSDEFDAPQLGLQWQWNANSEPQWFSLSARPGWLRLNATPAPGLWLAPNFLGQKFPAPAFTVTTKLDFSGLAVGEKTGLAILGMDYATLTVERKTNGCHLAQTVCHKADLDGAEIDEAETSLAGDTVYLRVKVTRDARCEFSHSRDGKTFSPLGHTFTAREGKWIGARVGLFASAPANAKTSGHADYDWFQFE